MHIKSFDWDIGNQVHILRHNVETLEVEEVFCDKPYYEKSSDDTYVAFGVSGEGRYLFVVFKYKGKGLIRVITARDMNKREKYKYKKKRK